MSLLTPRNTCPSNWFYFCHFPPWTWNNWSPSPPNFGLRARNFKSVPLALEINYVKSQTDFQQQENDEWQSNFGWLTLGGEREANVFNVSFLKTKRWWQRQSGEVRVGVGAGERDKTVASEMKFSQSSIIQIQRWQCWPEKK